MCDMFISLIKILHSNAEQSLSHKKALTVEAKQNKHWARFFLEKQAHKF